MSSADMSKERNGCINPLALQQNLVLDGERNSAAGAKNLGTEERTHVLPRRTTVMYSRDERLFLLAFIDKHIVEGNEHIAKMRRLIAEGDRQRCDLAEAKLRLAEFLTAQAQREAHREQVLRELHE